MRSRSLVLRHIEDLELATGGNREFRPTQMGARDVTGGLALAAFGGTTLVYGDFDCDIHVSGTFSDEQLTLGVILPRTKDATLCGKDLRPGDLIVAGAGRQIDARYRSALEYYAVNIDKTHALRIAASQGLELPTGLLDGTDVLAVERRRTAPLVRRLRALLGRMHDGSLRRIGPESEQWLSDEIALAFIECLPGAAPKTSSANDRNLPRLVQRAEEWLADEPLCRADIQQISQVLAVSTRQLYRAFQTEVGLSPAKYLKRYRMTQARLELLAADPANTTVTRVADSWGFWELGRFAVEYRQMFGESPSKTLRTPARRANGVAVWPPPGPGPSPAGRRERVR